MSVFSSKDFSANDSTRIRNMIASKLGVSAPATQQQCTDFLTAHLKLTTREHELAVARAAPSVTDPD
jgi:hypothetical protein